MVKYDSVLYTSCFLWVWTGLHIQMYMSNNSNAYGRSSVCICGWWFSVFIYQTNVLLYTHWKENNFKRNVANDLLHVKFVIKIGMILQNKTLLLCIEAYIFYSKMPQSVPFLSLILMKLSYRLVRLIYPTCQRTLTMGPLGDAFS